MKYWLGEAGALELLPYAFAWLCNVSFESAFVVDRSTFLERDGWWMHQCIRPTACQLHLASSAIRFRNIAWRFPFPLWIIYRGSRIHDTDFYPVYSTWHLITNEDGHELVWNSLPESLIWEADKNRRYSLLLRLDIEGDFTGARFAKQGRRCAWCEYTCTANKCT